MEYLKHSLKTYGSTDLTIPAIVSKITRTSGGIFTVEFKTYNGSSDFAASGSGSINDITTETLYFWQYPMNGLSPNSAKNLNFFRNGAGTDAIGYTWEWVEEKSNRSEEEILPKNPAVWETKQKENTDLDVYYEATGQNPIEIELTQENMLDFIPIGSEIEHESSNAIPPGTTITNVDETTQEITISVPVEVQ